MGDSNLLTENYISLLEHSYNRKAYITDMVIKADNGVISVM